jgi:transposase
MSKSLIIEALKKQLKAKDDLISQKDRLIVEKEAAYNELNIHFAELQRKHEELTYQYNSVLRIINNSKSETFKSLSLDNNDLKQGSLFDQEAVDALDADYERVQEQLEKDINEALRNQSSIKPAGKLKKNKNKPTGPKGFPEYLERRVRTIQPDGDLSDATLLGYDKKETLNFTPAQLWVDQTLIPKYLIKDKQKNRTFFLQAPAPNRPFDRLTASPSLLATLIVDKFAYHMPIYRQMKKFEHYGYAIPQGTICGWLDKAQELLAPLYQVLRNEVLKTSSLQADESPIDVQGIKEGKLHQAYMWLYRNVINRLVLFDFQLGRSAKYPIAMLKDYVGHLQVDGYGAYEHKEIGGKQEIILLYCHTHTRRNFVKSINYDKERANYYIQQIGRVYAVEQEIKDRNLTRQDKVAYREKYASPILDALGLWLAKQKEQVVPTTPIGKAINYAIERWEGLKTYLHFDFLEIDTNLLEQKVRRQTLGRKNWLFAGSKHGGQRIAMMYSLIACCEEYDIDPYAYFVDVISRIDPDNTKMSDLKELLPHKWRPAQTTVTVGNPTIQLAAQVTV